ncbi:MAG: signal peptidase II [Candidatus Bipolaricaulota bacterium]
MRRVSWAPYVLLLLALDRVTKNWAARNLALGDPQPLLGDVIRLTRVHNDGGAFGLLPGNAWLFVAVSAAAAVGLVIALTVVKTRRWVLRLGLSLVLVGALGNLFDRVMWGYVLDFFEFRGFPVFNVADACITLGALSLAVYALWGGGTHRPGRASHRP